MLSCHFSCLKTFLKPLCCHKCFDCGVWLKIVQITKYSDNQGPDNQGTTVLLPVTRQESMYADVSSRTVYVKISLEANNNSSDHKCNGSLTTVHSYGLSVCMWLSWLGLRWDHKQLIYIIWPNHTSMCVHVSMHVQKQ